MQGRFGAAHPGCCDAAFILWFAASATATAMPLWTCPDSSYCWLPETALPASACHRSSCHPSLSEAQLKQYITVPAKWVLHSLKLIVM